jgi:hypothetical protein
MKELCTQSSTEAFPRKNCSGNSQRRGLVVEERALPTPTFRSKGEKIAKDYKWKD